MAGIPNETYMEEYIVKYLTSHPILDANGNVTADMEYRELPASEYNKPENKEHCIIASELVAFLKDTQPKQYEKLVLAKNGDEETAKRSILDRLESEMRTKLKKATADNVKSSALTKRKMTVMTCLHICMQASIRKFLSLMIYSKSMRLLLFKTM